MIEKKNKWIWQLPFLVILIAGTTWIGYRHREEAKSNQMEWHQDEGPVFGTYYHTSYEAKQNLKHEIEEALKHVDNSLSMFNPHSTLSKINHNESNESDSLLNVVYALAQRVSQQTDGAFDITVAPLVNAWGFGYKSGTMPDSAQVDSLRNLIGWKRISLQDNKVHKEDARMVLDFGAIAKGFGSDVVADVFRRHGVKNYMIEIGGEVVVAGSNSKGKNWRIGINKPIDDSLSVNNELQDVLELTNCAMATSGNYRNFYITEDGRKVAHTIDPHTGYPVQHSILSATVIAPTCAEADAYATSFMVMGLDKAKQVLRQQPQLKAFIIYAEGKENKVYRTDQ